MSKISIFSQPNSDYQTQVPGRLGCWPIAFPPYFAGVPEVEAPGALQRGLHRSRTAAPRRSVRWRPSEISGKNILGQCAAILWSTMGLILMFHGYSMILVGKSPLFFWHSALICLGGAFLDRCGRIGGDWDCGFNYKACVCVAYFILTWMLWNSIVLESPRGDYSYTESLCSICCIPSWHNTVRALQ